MGVQRYDEIGLGERRIRRGLVTGLPRVATVVGLAFLFVADQRCARCERLLRRCDRRQRLVVDVDEVERVPGDVGVLGDDRRDLLALVTHLVRDEHRLRVAGKGRHPGELVRLQHLAGNHRDHARQR